MKSRLTQFPLAASQSGGLLPSNPTKQHKPPTMGDLAKFDVRLGELFDSILHHLITAFWSDEPELRLEHLLPMSNFVHTAVSHGKLFQRHRRAYLENQAADVIQDAMLESVKAISSAIDIYVRRFIEQDFTQAYFEATRCFNEARDIAWISDEVTLSDAQEIDCLSGLIQPKDNVYNFCSPTYTWENGYGRRGILVFRDNRIVTRALLGAS